MSGSLRTSLQWFCRLVVLVAMTEGVRSAFGWVPYGGGLVVLVVVLLAYAHSEGWVTKFEGGEGI